MNELPALLRIVRGEPEPDQPEPETAPLPVTESASIRLVPLPGAQMTWQQQANAAVLHALRAALLHAREAARREGGVIHGAYAGKPESLRELDEYARSRAWVPPGHEGGIAERENAIYLATVGRLGVALGLLWAWIFGRQLRLLIAIITILAIVIPLAVLA